MSFEFNSICHVILKYRLIKLTSIHTINVYVRKVREKILQNSIRILKMRVKILRQNFLFSFTRLVKYYNKCLLEIIEW